MFNHFDFYKNVWTIGGVMLSFLVEIRVRDETFALTYSARR